MIWAGLLVQVLKNNPFCYFPSNHLCTLGELLTVSGARAVQTPLWSACVLQPWVQGNVEVLCYLVSVKKIFVSWERKIDLKYHSTDPRTWWKLYSSVLKWFLKLVKAWLKHHYSQVCLYSDSENWVKQFSPKNSLNVAFVILTSRVIFCISWDSLFTVFTNTSALRLPLSFLE